MCIVFQSLHTGCNLENITIPSTKISANYFWGGGRRRLKKRSEKTEIARSKRKHRKGRGQAAAKKRSPLLRMWKRGRARSAKVHACGAQINREFQEISRECEGCLNIEDARAGALEARYGSLRTAAEERKKTKICCFFSKISQILLECC